MTSGDLIRVEYPPEWNLTSYYGIVIESWKEFRDRHDDDAYLVPHNDNDVIVLTPDRGSRVVERALVIRRWRGE